MPALSPETLTVTDSPGPDAMVLRLPPVLHGAAAHDLAAELRAAQGTDLTVTGTDVQRLGAQCVQVLISAQKTWALAGRSFALIDLSAEFVDAASLFGAHALVPTHSRPEMLS